MKMSAIIMTRFDQKYKKIILASASPRRRELLGGLGLSFEVIPAEGEEQSAAREPDRLVQELAYEKAKEVFGRLSGEEGLLVIGSDTVVSLDGEILGKPSDEEEAFSMLSRLSGRTHQVYTGVAVLAGIERIEQQIVFFEKTDVDFYPVSEEEIRSYIASGEPMDKAGAYGIQGRGGRFVRRIRGDYNTVVGLPAARLYQELKTIR